jgi:hypothetical protein
LSYGMTVENHRRQAAVTDNEIAKITV